MQAASRRGAMHGVLFFPQKSRWSSYSDLPLFTSYLSQTIHGTGISMVHLCNVPILMTHPCSVTYVTSIWVFVSTSEKLLSDRCNWPHSTQPYWSPNSMRPRRHVKGQSPGKTSKETKGSEKSDQRSEASSTQNAFKTSGANTSVKSAKR